MAETQTYRKKDCGYSWTVMIAAFLANMINAGFVTAPALLLVEWYSVFDKSTAMVAWLPALTILARSCSGIFVGGLVNRFGCRAVMMVSSVFASIALVCCSFSPNFEVLATSFSILGLCNGLMYNLPIVIIYEYFDKYKSLASGLSLCGHSLSSFIMVALYRYSIDTFGWRGAMLIMAGMALNGCVCGMIFVTNTEKTEADSKLCKALQFSGLINCNYVMFVMAVCLQKCQVNVLVLLSTSRAVSKGLSEMEGSMLIPCIGIASTISRFFISWISNMKCTSHIALYTAAVLSLSALIAVSCIQPESLIYNGTVLALCGIVIGCASTMAPATLVDILGQSGLANGLGMSSAVQGLPNALILPAAGFVYDQTGDFNNSFYLGAAIGFLGGCLSLIIVVRNCFSAERPETTQDTAQEDKDRNPAQIVGADDVGSQILYVSKTSINASAV